MNGLSRQEADFFRGEGCGGYKRTGRRRRAYIVVFNLIKA